MVLAQVHVLSVYSVILLYNMCLYFFFHCLLCYLLRANFLILLFVHAYIIMLYSDVGHKLSINGKQFYFPCLY